MLDGLLDKDTTLDLAARVSTAPAKPRGARISVDPRVWLGVWRKPGFTVVDLDGASATVRYVDMDGMLWRAPDTL